MEPERAYHSELSKASAVKRRHRQWFQSIPGLTSVGVSVQADGAGCIVVTFASRETIENVISQAIIPPVLDGVKVVIEDEPATFELATDTSRYRPAIGGCSISSPTATGTLGGWVRDRINGYMCIISCEHVLDVTNNLGANIIQPSALHDGGNANNDMIAVNLRGIRDLDYDCAIARVVSEATLANLSTSYCGVMAERSIAHDDNRPTQQTIWYGHGGLPYIGEHVEKRGRTTELTEGTVERLDVDLVDQQQNPMITDVFEIESVDQNNFVEGGDSGSLVTQVGSHSVRGLLTATRADNGRFGYAQHWNKVAERLQLDPTYHVIQHHAQYW